MSIFSNIKEAQTIKCSRVYRTDEGKPYYIPILRKADNMVLAYGRFNHLPILGIKSFIKAV